MTPQRQGEIALKLIKNRLRKTLRDVTREVGNVAKECDIPLDELKKFAKPILHDALDEVFSGSDIKITPRR